MISGISEFLLALFLKESSDGCSFGCTVVLSSFFGDLTLRPLSGRTSNIVSSMGGN